MKNTKAFTLVELIVVVTILAILSTIGFVSYSGYLAGVRDTNRIAQLKAIGDALHLYSTNKSLPTPDDKIDIKTNTKIISYQGYVGKDVIETVGYTAEGLDPKDKTYFSYYLTKDKKYFQLMAFLEEEKQIVKNNPLLHKINAIDYEDRYPRVEGDKLGILTGIGNIPIQELITGEIDLITSYAGVEAHISNSKIQTGTSLKYIASDSSCKRLYEVGGKRINGFYNIDQAGDGVYKKIYCQMETLKNNMLEANWTIGSGSFGNFIKNGTDSENIRTMGTTPSGSTDIIWVSKAMDNTNGPDGGWDYKNITVDHLKTYRLSVWVKRLNSNTGNSHFGTLNSPTGSEYVKNANNGAVNQNPYFGAPNFIELDKWYLYVGYVHGSNYNLPTSLGGAYDGVTGEKVRTFYDFIQVPNNTLLGHRAYQYYTNNENSIQHFYNPRFEEITESEIGDVKDLIFNRYN